MSVWQAIVSAIALVGVVYMMARWVIDASVETEIRMEDDDAR